jgi:hypothetical protein
MSTVEEVEFDGSLCTGTYRSLISLVDGDGSSTVSECHEHRITIYFRLLLPHPRKPWRSGSRLPPPAEVTATDAGTVQYARAGDIRFHVRYGSLLYLVVLPGQYIRAPPVRSTNP